MTHAPRARHRFETDGQIVFKKRVFQFLDECFKLHSLPGSIDFIRRVWTYREGRVMAVGEQRVGRPTFNLNDEPDLSESALDGVVGGTAGAGAGKVGMTKDQGVMAEISTLLHDAASVNTLEHQAEKSSGKDHGAPATASETLHGAIDGLVDKNAAALADLSSKLSTQQMGHLLDAMNSAGSVPSTDKQIQKDAAAILGTETATHHLAGGSDVASYLHDAANSAVMQNHLDKLESGHSNSKLPQTAAERTLQEAMGSLVDKDSNALVDLSSKLSSEQLTKLTDFADGMRATTTNQAIESDANIVTGSGHGGTLVTEVEKGWNQIKQVSDIPTPDLI